VYTAKYQNLYIPTILCILVADKYLIISFCSLTLPKWLFSSFDSKSLSVTKNIVLCPIPLKNSAYVWDIQIITVTVMWPIWRCPLPGDNIYDCSAPLKSISNELVSHYSQNITQLLGKCKTSSSGTAAMRSSTYLSTTL
jgi:hypothetical protein